MAERLTILEASRAAGVDPPVGTDVRQMSRVEFDRLSEERHWPRGDYDARRGLAEVVAEPLPGHEGRVVEAGMFVRALCGERAVPTGALRIEWRGSVLEPDGSFYFVAPGGGPRLRAGLEWTPDPRLVPAVEPIASPGYGADEACCPEKGHEPPALVVEVNRTSNPVRAAEKRADYLEMGVREIWAWRPRDGATIYRRGEDGEAETVPESGVLPGVTREALEELWADAEWGESGRQCAAVVRRVLERAGAVEGRVAIPGEARGDEDG